MALGLEAEGLGLSVYSHADGTWQYAPDPAVLTYHVSSMLLATSITGKTARSHLQVLSSGHLQYCIGLHRTLLVPDIGVALKGLSCVITRNSDSLRSTWL